MDQHPVPRQITTFEFKLVGFFTVKQFLYILFFVPIGFLVYFIFPIPLLNMILGIIIGGFGFALALIPINDRPLDVWIKNLIKRLTSPTQYIYHKNNAPIYFFNNLYFVSDPHRVLTHIESQEKLSAYLARTQATIQPNQKKQDIHSLFQKNKKVEPPKQSVQASPAPVIQPQPVSKPVPQAQEEVKDGVRIIHAPKTAEASMSHTPLPQIITAPAFQQPKQVITTPVTPVVNSVVTGPKPPFFTGVVRNHKLIPIPGILIYVKDGSGKTLRLLKTNPHGIFATFSTLAPGTYTFDLKDPRNSYFFDTMNKEVSELNPIPFEFTSKEML